MVYLKGVRNVRNIVGVNINLSTTTSDVGET